MGLSVLPAVAHAEVPTVSWAAGNAPLYVHTGGSMSRDWDWTCTDPSSQTPLTLRCRVYDGTAGGIGSGNEVMLVDVLCDTSDISPVTTSYVYDVPPADLATDTRYYYSARCSDSASYWYESARWTWYDVSPPTVAFVATPPATSSAPQDAGFQFTCYDTAFDYDFGSVTYTPDCDLDCALFDDDTGAVVSAIGNCDVSFVTDGTTLATHDYSSLGAGTYRFEVYSTDSVGNDGTTATWVWTVGPFDDGGPCDDDGDCISNQCVDDICCAQSSCPACQSCDVSGVEGSCQPDGAAGEDPDSECPNGACDGAGACVLYDAQPCTDGSECLSGICADDVCCDDACTDACQACDVSGSEGTCSPVPAGEPGDPSCEPYLCDGNDAACPTDCDTADDCADAHFCDGDSMCTPLVGLGGACGDAGDCESTFCVDGVCCDEACGDDRDPCQVCSADAGANADGECTLVTSGPECGSSDESGGVVDDSGDGGASEGGDAGASEDGSEAGASESDGGGATTGGADTGGAESTGGDGTYGGSGGVAEGDSCSCRTDDDRPPFGLLLLGLLLLPPRRRKQRAAQCG